MKDHVLEQEIRALGLTAPRVTPQMIDNAMLRVEYTVVQRPGGSTSTFVHAFLDARFYLATGMSACVSPENFNADIGRNLAMDKCQAAAREKLWELLGFMLYQQLRHVEGLDKPSGDYPLYVGTKAVKAFKVAEIRQGLANEPTSFTGGSWWLYPENLANPNLQPLEVSHEWFVKHSPQIGGYVVIYPDQHISYSPALAFEKHYQELHA